MIGMNSDVFEQIRSAYRLMSSKARFRPAAPSDGFGNIPDGGLNFEKEVHEYAERWWNDEEQLSFFIGNGDFETRRALIFTIEAARNLCAGRLGDHTALRLLKLALKELEQVTKDKENDLVYRALNVG